MKRPSSGAKCKERCLTQKQKTSQNKCLSEELTSASFACSSDIATPPAKCAFCSWAQIQGLLAGASRCPRHVGNPVIRPAVQPSHLLLASQTKLALALTDLALPLKSGHHLCVPDSGVNSNVWWEVENGLCRWAAEIRAEKKGNRRISKA